MELSKGNGDLTQRLKIETNDDLGEISEGVNQFIASLQTMILEIKRETEALNGNVYKLKGNQTVVDSMSITKGRCQQAATGAGEVSESLDTMTGIVSEINDLSTQVAAAAEEQSNVTHEVSKNMVAINSIVGKLDSNGKQAVEEINSIDDINHRLTVFISKFKV